VLWKVLANFDLIFIASLRALFRPIKVVGFYFLKGLAFIKCRYLSHSPKELQVIVINSTIFRHSMGLRLVQITSLDIPHPARSRKKDLFHLIILHWDLHRYVWLTMHYLLSILNSTSIPFSFIRKVYVSWSLTGIPSTVSFPHLGHFVNPFDPLKSEADQWQISHITRSLCSSPDISYFHCKNRLLQCFHSLRR